MATLVIESRISLHVRNVHHPCYIYQEFGRTDTRRSQCISSLNLHLTRAILTQHWNHDRYVCPTAASTGGAGGVGFHVVLPSGGSFNRTRGSSSIALWSGRFGQLRPHAQEYLQSPQVFSFTHRKSQCRGSQNSLPIGKGNRTACSSLTPSRS